MHQLDIIFKEDLSSKGSKIPVGIHTNCEVTGIEVTPEYIDLNFKDEQGRTNNKRLWAPKGSYPRDKETVADAKTREERENLAHLTKLVHIFLGEEGVKKFAPGEYLTLADNVAKQLRPKLSSKKVNLKLIYDKDGAYAVFGTFPDYVEECIPNEAPKLEFTKWETENRLTRKAKTVGKGDHVSDDKVLDDILG